MSTNCSPIQSCIPQGIVSDPLCTSQALSLDCDTGVLSLSSANSINLDCAVKLLETKTILSSVTLTGTILQIIYLGEDSVPQAKNVDLSSIAGTGGNIGVQNSNSILLHNGNNTLTATLNIDPASSLPISSSPSGVLFGCCPETVNITNNTNTIQLAATGSVGHIFTANLKYQSSGTILLSDSSNGLSAAVKYSTDANNAVVSGTDGGVYVASASSQLANLSNNGFVTTGSAGTLLVGSDSKLYRIPDPIAESQIIGNNTNTVALTVNGPNNHTIQAGVRYTNTNSALISETGSGLQVDVKLDTVTPGNVGFTETINGLVGNITESSILGVQNSVATVQNPITKIYGNLNNGAGGYAVGFLSQYGLKTPNFTTTQRFAIPSTDLYDSLLVFDTTLRQYYWYDAVTPAWIQIGATTSPTTPTIYTWSNAANTGNYTINAANAIRLSDLTGQANRNIVLPASPTTIQQLLIIKNVNSSGFNWTFTGTTVFDMSDSAVTTLSNNTTYQLSWDGVAYNIIN